MDAFPIYARNLTLDPQGFWVAKRSEPLSYPEDGNDLYFALEDDSFWFRHRNAAIVALARRFPPNGPLFDIGGGNGYVALGLEQAGFSTVLIEPGRTGAANARRRGLRNVICATSDAAEFAPRSLPAVGLFDVLEHIEDDLAFLVSLRELLRPGGRLYLTVPAFAWLWSDEDERVGHFRRYTRRSLARVLRAAGFDVEYLTYFFWFLPLPIGLFRALPSRFGWRSRPTPQSAQREHTAGRGWSARLIERALQWERRWLSRGRTLPIGGSCLAVARTRDR